MPPIAPSCQTIPFACCRPSVRWSVLAADLAASAGLPSLILVSLLELKVVSKCPLAYIWKRTCWETQSWVQLGL